VPESSFDIVSELSIKTILGCWKETVTAFVKREIGGPMFTGIRKKIQHSDGKDRALHYGEESFQGSDIHGYDLQ
jgi:hypothetical protein